MSKPTEKFKRIDVTVRGLEYYVTPDTMRKMRGETPMPVRLERDPMNERDANAIRVIIDERPWKGFHIGYVARQVSAVLAEKMDNGTLGQEEAWLMWVDPDISEGGIRMKVRVTKD